MKPILQIPWHLHVLLLATIGLLAVGACDSKASSPRTIMIGDDVFATTGNIETYLATFSKETYRRYYREGAELSGGATSNLAQRAIPLQYQRAVNEDPNITTVIMNGGANDIIRSGAEVCIKNLDLAACLQQIEEATTALDELLAQMNSDGVRIIIYLGFHHPQNESLRAMADQAVSKIKPIVEGNGAIYVDPRPAFDASNDALFFDAGDASAGNGVIPSPAGSRILADLIWDALVKAGGAHRL